ncbi:MAG TPA: dihydroxyacetone kinase subunit DhaL [Candidatus Methylacidiphilales bacterium]|jgi:dihydroxyacetone kinase-like protein|nr:dihydroxyacetone kinase subunit DhaL [Candidatus Methylacidiphilales bacterium]
MNELNKSSRRMSPVFQVKFTSETLRRWMALYTESIRESEQLLTDLDAAIGDADHGTNMRRGMNAVSEKLEALALADLSGQMRVISTTLMSSVGGAAGPLYGAFFLQCSHATMHKTELGLSDLTAALEAGVRGVVQLGKAAVGDKTMVDTLTAAMTSLRASCQHHEAMPDALKACRKAARLAAEGTIPMVARKGRASYLGERSAGTQDPGATSSALLFETLSQSVLLTSFKPRVTSTSRLQTSILL